jgi:hypothetical protein
MQNGEWRRKRGWMAQDFKYSGPQDEKLHQCTHQNSQQNQMERDT